MGWRKYAMVQSTEADTLQLEEEPAATASQPKQSAAAAEEWARWLEEDAARKRENTLRRISRELECLSRDQPPYCRPGPEPVTDPSHWEAVIDGPAGTPYAGGTFPIDVSLPEHYPCHPPKLTFKTKVYHPNIDEKGQMVLDVLQQYEQYWTPCYSVPYLLLAFVSVLYDPLLDRPINNNNIARQYEYDYERYEEEARAWTQEYSSTPIASPYPPNAVKGRTPPVVPHFPATAARRRAASAAAAAAAESSSSGSGESLWRRAVAYVQSWSPYRLLHRE